MPRKITLLKRIAPSSWASYLINADASSLTDEDIAACDAWVESLPYRGKRGPHPSTCDDVGFRHSHDARAFYKYAADCQEYTWLVIDEEHDPSGGHP